MKMTRVTDEMVDAAYDAYVGCGEADDASRRCMRAALEAVLTPDDAGPELTTRQQVEDSLSRLDTQPEPVAWARDTPYGRAYSWAQEVMDKGVGFGDLPAQPEPMKADAQMAQALQWFRELMRNLYMDAMVLEEDQSHIDAIEEALSNYQAPDVRTVSRPPDPPTDARDASAGTSEPEPSVPVSDIERLIINWVGITGGVYVSAPEYSRGYDNGVNQCASMLRDLIQREKPLERAG